ncbi:glycosyltransferase family 8 protein [Mesorhizobium sp.]|uniref:glycosyltransferase family 8 protein n=1 Tax=Mesorhizobium sp. TaxID=1871066 RepID=UPI003BAD8BAF
MIIVSASDNNFVPGLFTLVYSAWLHNRAVKFFIISVDIEPENISSLLTFCRKHQISCKIIHVNDGFARGLPTNEQWTGAAYARFLIPDLLPNESKAIYLDADAVVVSSLDDLWSMNMGDNLVAGVLDGFVHQGELDSIELTADEYINSGVLVMNLDAWRRENIADKMFKEARRSKKITFPDQTVLNSVARGRVLLLGREWNFCSGRYVSYERKTPKILHFSGDGKPWVIRNAPFSSIYNSYRILSGSNIPAASVDQKLISARKMAMGLVRLRWKYWSVALAFMYYKFTFMDPHIRKLRKQVEGARSA